jgi:hypothetical protein
VAEILCLFASRPSTLRYLRLNARKHFRQRFGKTPPATVDPASSGRCFEDWAGGVSGIRDGPREMAHPRSWLLSEGWKRQGLIDPAAVPGF